MASEAKRRQRSAAQRGLGRAPLSHDSRTQRLGLSASLAEEGTERILAKANRPHNSRLRTSLRRFASRGRAAVDFEPSRWSCWNLQQWDLGTSHKSSVVFSVSGISNADRLHPVALQLLCPSPPRRKEGAESWIVANSSLVASISERRLHCQLPHRVAACCGCTG